jgi:hypothetical protein
MLLPNANDAGVAMAQAESDRAYCTLALDATSIASLRS